MKNLRYKVIKSSEQYKQYCNILERLLSGESITDEAEDEIELLTVLIEKYDKDRFKPEIYDPVQILKLLMSENGLKARDLTEILGVSKGLVSDILNYKRGMSKSIIRRLSEYFKIDQEAFNRVYGLKRNKSQFENVN
jgi:HTH-type transcriptional regulator/antitoxin HigA